MDGNDDLTKGLIRVEPTSVPTVFQITGIRGIR